MPSPSKSPKSLIVGPDKIVWTLVEKHSALALSKIIWTIPNYFGPGPNIFWTFWTHRMTWHNIDHRELKLDGAKGQGEICNYLKNENFSKTFLSHIGKNKLKL